MMPRSLTSQPSRASIAISMKRLESNSCDGARGAPGETSSLPVENTATRMRLRTSTWVRPNAAASATSCGRSRRPALSAAKPEAMSSPAGRTLAPGFRPAGSTTLPASSIRTSSCMNTVSAPSGIGAPVKIRTAWPGWNRAPGRRAGLDAPGHGKRLLLALRQIAAAHRIAIDGGIGERRQRQRRRNVAGENRAHRPRASATRLDLAHRASPARR